MIKGAKMGNYKLSFDSNCNPKKLQIKWTKKRERKK